jgi:DNA polymerase-3 subunit gamma/tau
MSDAMLLYDEINRKGFEGDTVLEGFAEFIRNILVSKDTKAAILLEVAEDFKQKYLQAAQKIDGGWLIAALNLLTEAEINYKQARNKRLLLELTIIKLSYLQQAIELVNNDGVVSKKKLVESVKPVAFRSVPIIRVKEELQAKAQLAQPQEARLIIEEPEVKVSSKKQTTNNKPQITDNRPPTTNNQQPSNSISSLAKIRQKVSEQNKNNGNDLKELTEEELYVAWGAFIEKLVQRKNHSAVTNFKMATLRVIDNNTLEIVTENNIQQKFIEQERADLVEHLQSHFCNRQLIYSVIIVENEHSDQPVERTLSSKEQYLKIIEEYPLVKELKDRLKLELDY